MRSKHSAAIHARMRRTGEGYYVAREAYLREMNMPLEPPSQKRARAKARDAEEAAVFLEYGADVLGVHPRPEVLPLIARAKTGA